MKFEILLDMLFDLLAKRKITATYVADKFEISTRTVYRYVDVLSMAVPVYVKRGRDGGICIADSYKLPKGFMTKDEYQSAIEALTTMYAQLPEERFLQAKRKLSAQVKAETRELALTGEIGSIIVDGGSWGDTESFSQKLRIVEESIKELLVLEIEYQARDGKRSTRSIEPHALVFKQNVWYVYAFCLERQEFRLFRVGRIVALLKTQTVFQKRPFTKEDIPLHFWTDETQSVCARLEISPESFADAQDWLGVENLRPHQDGWQAEVTLPNDDALVLKIVSLGAGVKVLSPTSLQEKVAQTAKRIAEQYQQ